MCIILKMSKTRFDILFVFIIIILIQVILFFMYQSVVLADSRKENLEEIKKLVENQEIVLSDEEQKTLDLINQYRRENGLKELIPFSNLQEVAKLKAIDLVNNQYFSHNSPILGTPFEMLKNNGIDYITAGENLAGNITPENAVKAWINSPTHRDNLLDDSFEYTGICVIDSSIYGKVFVQLFIGVE